MANIIKKLKSEFDKGLASVSVNSSTLIETTKINGIITSLKEKREILIKQLGELTYDEMSNNSEVTEEAKREIFNEIIEIDNKIIEKLENIKKLNEEKKEVISMISKDIVETQKQSNVDNGETCECGRKIKENAKFCTGCGKTLEIKEQKKEESILCKCGAEIKEDARFCSACGEQFEL